MHATRHVCPAANAPVDSQQRLRQLLLADVPVVIIITRQCSIQAALHHLLHAPASVHELAPHLPQDDAVRVRACVLVLPLLAQCLVRCAAVEAAPLSARWRRSVCKVGASLCSA